MYCSKCGSYLPEGVSNCPNCNEPINANTQNYNSDGTYYTPPQNNEEQSNYYQNPSENAYQPNPQYNYQYNAPQFNDVQIKSALSNATTLGILAIILGIIITPIAGIICGAIGLSKANSVPDMLNPSIDKEKAKAKKLNIIGIVLPIALWVVFFILMLIFVLCFGYGTVAYSYY